MTRAEVRELQTRLNESGFAYQVLGEPLEIDGIYGRDTDLVYRAWLDRDTAVPTIAPPIAEPWWKKKSILVMAAGLIAGGAGIAGYDLDALRISELLSAIAGAVTILLGIVQTIKGEAPVDPTLLARTPARDVRFSGMRQRVALPPERQPDKPWPREPDPRGNFETE